MKKGVLGAIARALAALMVFTGCDGLVTSNVDVGDGKGSGHYYVDLVPGPDIPIVEDLNNGVPSGDTSYVLAEAFNKYDAVYYAGNQRVTVPPGKTLYVAPGSAVPGFHVAAEISKGVVARAGAGTAAGPARLVVLEGATMPLSGASTLGGLLQVNVGGAIVRNSSATITGAGRVVVGGKVTVDSITVAGDVYVAQGNGKDSGIVEADIDTTYLALPTNVPNEKGLLGNTASADDFYAFETVTPETSREVRIDGVALGNITSGGNVYVAENSRVTGLNVYYGYVAGSSAPSNSTIITCGDVEVLGNVTGNVIAKGSVTVGSALTDPHRAQVSGGIYSRTGNVVIKTNANSGEIVAYKGNVTIEKGAAATGIDTWYGDYGSYSGRKYDGNYDEVNRGDVIVFGRVQSSISDSKASSAGSGEISAGGSVLVHPYGSSSGVFSDDGYVGGNVAARRSATIDGVVLGNLDTSSCSFDGTGTQNVIVNGFVGGYVKAGGALTVADHHEVPANVNPGKSVYVSSRYIYANGYVGGGATVYSHNGEGSSVINGLVEGGPLEVSSSANVTIASTGRVDTMGSGNDASVLGKLAIAAGGELDANSVGDIGINSAPLTGIHILAHANGLYNSGRLGSSSADSGITIASGAKVYTAIPVAIPTQATLDWISGSASGAAATAREQDTWFNNLAGSTTIHTNVAPPVSGFAGIATPLALAVGQDNAVTLTRDTALAGTISVNGLLILNGYELALNGQGVVTLGSDNSYARNYGTDYINGSIVFALPGSSSASSLKFNTATAALNGLSASVQDYSGNTTVPVVIGVQSSLSDSAYSTSCTVASFTPSVATRPGGPVAGTFVPGAGVALEGFTSYSHGDNACISKTSRAIWAYSAP
jgi:hypothetical protein